MSQPDAAPQASPPKKKIVRTSAGLRDVLFDELDAIREGRSNPQKAQATAKLACQIINSVKMEIEFYSHVQSTKSGATALSRSIDLSERGIEKK